jgi:taurine dioxygenase
MVYPKVLPTSIRETYYIDMHEVYKKLPLHLHEVISNRNILHEGKMRYKVQPCDIDRAIIDILREIEKKAPPAIHPAVIIHPVTGEEILYINEGFTTKIIGLEHEKSQEVLQELFTFIERDEHIHRHQWEMGDILLWDNRPLIHKASTVPKGEPSVSHRIGVYDGLEFYVKQNQKVKVHDYSTAAVH